MPVWLVTKKQFYEYSLLSANNKHSIDMGFIAIHNTLVVSITFHMNGKATILMIGEKKKKNKFNTSGLLVLFTFSLRGNAFTRQLLKAKYDNKVVEIF